jgi:hypothetical protein
MWTGNGLDESEQGGFVMTMTRIKRTEGCCQLLQSSLAAFRAYHRHTEEEEEAMKLVAFVLAMKREEDAE